MAITASYKCNKCGNAFEARVGGLMTSSELRCADCDNSMYVEVGTKEGICEKCGGKMVDNLSLPMCPSCKSRDVIKEKTLLMLD